MTGGTGTNIASDGAASQLTDEQYATSAVNLNVEVLGAAIVALASVWALAFLSPGAHWDRLRQFRYVILLPCAIVGPALLFVAGYGLQLIFVAPQSLAVAGIIVTVVGSFMAMISALGPQAPGFLKTLAKAQSQS